MSDIRWLENPDQNPIKETPKMKLIKHCVTFQAQRLDIALCALLFWSMGSTGPVKSVEF